jgi:hypothetical protein
MAVPAKAIRPPDATLRELLKGKWRIGDDTLRDLQAGLIEYLPGAKDLQQSKSGMTSQKLTEDGNQRRICLVALGGGTLC